MFLQNIGRIDRNKEEYEKILLIFLCAGGHLNLTSAFMGCYRVPYSKSQDVLKQHFKNLLNACSDALNKRTNKQT